MTVFRKLAERYPSSRLAAQAEFAAAKIKLESFVPEERPDDSTFVDSTMILEFKQLSEKYPDSPFGQEALKLSRGEIVTRAAPALTQQEERPDTMHQETDSTQILSDSGDTLSAGQLASERLQSDLDTLPLITIEEPTVKGEFVYPVSASGTKFEGKLVLKIKIEFDGKVTEVVFLKGSNNADIDREVKRAMLETFFDPIQFDPLKLSRGYFIYNYEVILPEVYR
jgi:TonB family protein